MMTSNFAYAQKTKKAKRRIYTNHNLDMTNRGHLQIESNLIYENNFIGSDNFYLTDNRFRFGVSNSLEVFVDMDLFYNKNQGYGVLPLGFGFKADVFQEKNYLPDISLIGALQIGQLGSAQYDFQYVLPTFGIIFQKQFAKNIYGELDYLVQWIDSTTTPTHVIDYETNFQLSKNASVSVGFIYNSTTDYSNPNFMIEGGVSKKINNNWTLSLEAGKFLSNEQQNFYLGLGITRDIKLKKQNNK